MQLWQRSITASGHAKYAPARATKRWRLPDGGMLVGDRAALDPHYGASNRSTSFTSARKKGSTSVTRPTVWKEPRSASLMTVEGLMSTQTTFTHAGSRLPT